MPKFIVTIHGRCNYTQNVEIEAEDASHAMALYRDGDHDVPDETTYDHTETDRDIEEVKPEPKKGK